MMTLTRAYDQIRETYGDEEFTRRSRAGYALFNNYGFTADLTRIHIEEADDERRYLRFTVGRHVYELTGDKLEKVE